MVRHDRASGIPSRELFDSHPMPMWVYDLGTLAFLAVNDAAIRHYGYTRREFLTMTIKDIRPPEEIPALLARVARTVDGHDSSGVWRHRKKDGTIIDVEIVSHTVPFAGRRAKLILANDVTERTRLERELRAAGEAWRQTFDAMRDAVALLDPAGKIVRCNKAMALLARKDLPEILGRPCWEVMDCTSRRIAGCPMSETNATSKTAASSVRVGDRVFKVRTDPLLDERGGFHGVVHVMTDFTDQEKSEKTLRDLALQQKAILDNIPDLAWLKDDQSRFLAVNGSFAAACRLAPAEVIGKTDLDIWPRELAERYRADDAEVMRSRARKVVEEPLADKTGRPMVIETAKAPIIDEHGRVAGTAGIARDVTERRRLEDALLRKGHMLSEAQRIAHIGSWEADLLTGTVLWSEEMHRIYGTSPATFVPTVASYLRMVHPDDRKAMAGWIRATAAGKRLENLEFRFLRPDGCERWVRGTVEPLLNAAGHPIGAIGTGQDFTDDKRAEELRQASEKKFRTLFEAADDAIFIVDGEGNFVDANSTAYQRLGFSKEELLSKNVAEIDTPEFAARVPERVEHIRRFGKAVFETAHLRKDGTVMPVEINAVAVELEGRMALLNIVRDVTERKRTESALRSSRLLYEKTLASLNEAVLIVDVSTRVILDCNPATEQIFGYAREELVGRSTGFLHVNDEMSTAFSEQKLLHFEENGHAEFQFQMRRKNGEVFPTEHFLRPLLDDGGNPLGVLSVVRDISERRTAEQALLEHKAFTEHLIQASSVATFVLNERHEVVLWNDACAELTGVKAAAILGSTEAWRPFYAKPRAVLADLVLAPDQELLSRLYPVATPSVLVAEGLHAESWVDDLNGKRRYITFDAAPIRNNDGSIAAVIETILDNTASKQAEESLAESEARYRNLFDNANDLIQSVAPDGHFLYVNAAWRRVLGYEQDELRTLTVFDIIHPSCTTSCLEKFAMVMSGEGIDVLEAKFVAKNGRAVDVEGSVTARLVDGKTVSTQGIFRDVTERKKLEEEIYRISHDWEETFNTLTDMVTVHDRDFNIIRANTAAAKILDLPFLGAKPAKCFERYHGTACPPAGCPSCRSLVTGTASVSEMFEPHLGRTIEIRAIPRLDAAGQVVGLIHVVRDTTERAQAERMKKQQMQLAEFGMHIGTALNREGTLVEILGACTDLMVNNLGAAFARIWTTSPDGTMLVLQASSGIYTHRDGSHGRIPLDSHLKIPTIARTRRPHLTNAVVGDEQIDQEWAVREGMVAFAGYPLLVGTHVVGVIAFFSRRHLDEMTFDSLEAVANNIALGIERIQSEAALKLYSEELSALSAASNNLLAPSSLSGLHEEICRFAVTVFGVELAWLGLTNEGSASIEVAGRAGEGEEYLRTLKVNLDDSPHGRGPTGRAIRSRQPQVSRRDAPEFAPWRALAEESGFETSLAVPLLSQSDPGTCIGALNLYSRSPAFFTPDRVRLCQIYANQAAIAIENARLVTGLEEKVEARTREFESANVELQLINKELEIRRVEAETASKTKSDFLANMSHELRTPLNAIIGFSDLLFRGMAGPLAEKQREYLGDILSGGRHLLSLINDILDLSKIEAGKMAMELAEYELAALIDRSFVMFREKALKHRLDLSAEIVGTIAPLVGDERKIRQVLYNLLSNAVKFSPDGGAITVRARTVREAGRDYAEISVSDTGVGISPEDQKRLFLPFGQLSHHLTKDREGTGLGLALCKNFVEMHGGRIWVESTPGRGSTFAFRIPVRFDGGTP